MLASWHGCPAERTVPQATLAGCQDAAIAHQRHAADIEGSLISLDGQRQIADWTLVLLRPRAALLHEHQLIPRIHALLTSPGALPASPLFLAVCAIRPIAFARPADHRNNPAVSNFDTILQAQGTTQYVEPDTRLWRRTPFLSPLSLSVSYYSLSDSLDSRRLARETTLTISPVY